MRFLTFLVVFMGILIVAGLAFLIYGLSMGLHKKDRASSISLTADKPAVPQPFGDHTLALPDNQTVLSSEVQDNRLIIHLQDTVTKAHQWLMIDLQTGEKLGSVKLPSRSLGKLR